MSIAGVNIGQYMPTIGGEALKLRRYVEGAANADVNAGNARTPTDYKCQGYLQGAGSNYLRKGPVREKTVTFGIYGATLVGVRPVVGDRVVYGGVEHEVYDVPADEQDSQGAVWVVYTVAVTP